MSMKPNEDAYITQSGPYDEYPENDREPLEWEFVDRIGVNHRGEATVMQWEIAEEFEVIVKQEDCTALMWAFIVTQNSFEKLTHLARNILFMARIDGKWNLVTQDKAEVYLTPWTKEDPLSHYEACQALSEKLKRCVYPAFLAEDIK